MKTSLSCVLLQDATKSYLQAMKVLAPSKIQTRPMQFRLREAVWLLPLQPFGIQPADTTAGVSVRGGCSVYSALLAGHPAHHLITLHSECLRPM